MAKEKREYIRPVGTCHAFHRPLKQYQTRQEADEMAQRFNLHVFECPHCGNFHLTHLG